MTSNALTLYELNSLVAEGLHAILPDKFWVEAELSEVRVVRGNCYMEIVQKDILSNTPIAKAQAKCWRNIWPWVQNTFEQTTGQQLRPGMKVMLQVHADFHEAYGFSWIVTDINPEFTLGDMMKKRNEIVKELKAAGIFDLQRDLSLPLFAQNIAVISSCNAAGYGDFCSEIDHSGLVFHLNLFPSIMQGENIESSIIHALNLIYKDAAHTDIVVIIRGGGATSDLSGFDSLSLAENIANFPIPILTGIGHDRDQSIADMVAYRSLKTPTAVANFLVNNLKETSRRIEVAQQAIIKEATMRLEMEKQRLKHLVLLLPSIFSTTRKHEFERLENFSKTLNVMRSHILENEKKQLETIQLRLKTQVTHKLLTSNQSLKLLSQRLSLNDPQLLLQRGYTITTKDGHIVKDAQQLEKGDKIETRFRNGKIQSVVVQ